MFKKSERLSRSEFSEYFRIGKRHHFSHCTIITAPHQTRKAAVVVGKKVAKSAVRRNTIKRRVYAALRALLPASHQGVIIILIKPTYNSLTRQAADSSLRESIAEVLKST